MVPFKLNRLVLALVKAGLVTLSSATVMANPQDGTVAAGKVTIQQESATKLGITQSSDKAIVDWRSFSIAPNEHTQIYMPSSQSVILNRVVGQDSSEILGRFTANGQVFLVNPNGIFFGKGSQIDVAGLVASTHNIRNADFLAGHYNFTISGKPDAAVINEGLIRVADTGIAAFVASSVANQGVVVAKLGKVLLASANGFTLDFSGDQLLTFLVNDEVAKTAFDMNGKPLTSFVENSGIIEAQGGHVLMTAKAAENAIHSVINQTGTIEATTVGTKKGDIILQANQGSLSVAGTLNASAPNGGDGGFIETSGTHVKVADSTQVTTKADNGKSGTWLIDPVDFTIAASGGDMTALTVNTALNSGNVQIQSTKGVTGTKGDINVNEELNWSANTTLTLDAQRKININAPIVSSGDSAGVVLKLSLSKMWAADYLLFNNGGNLTLSGVNATLSMNGINYTLINDVTQLQDINSVGYYALGNNIDASVTRGWNGGLGFSPISLAGVGSALELQGLGHSISNLYINRSAEDNIGLFATLQQGGFSDLTLVHPQISGRDNVGSFIGIAGANPVGSAGNTSFTVYFNNVKSNNVFISGRTNVGGVTGTSIHTYFDQNEVQGTVAGTSNVGGVIGEFVSNTNQIRNSQFQGTVTASGDNAGGLIGQNSHNTSGGFLISPQNNFIITSYADAQVTAKNNAGGLVGDGSGLFIVGSYATGSTSALSSNAGGLLGFAAMEHNTNSYRFGTQETTINNSYAANIVSSPINTGGLIGQVSRIYNSESFSPLTASYWNAQLSGETNAIGGIVAGNKGSVTWDNSFGKNTAQMQQQATFAGWDFTNTWRIVEGSSYPLLRALTQGTITVTTTPLDVTASNVSKVYDGVAVNTVADLQKLGFTVTAGNTLASGDTLPALGVAGTGVWSGTLNLGGTWQGATNVGNYTIQPGGLSSQKYDIVYKNGALDITPASVSLVKITGERVYDGTNKAYASDVWLSVGVLAKDQSTVNLAPDGIGILDGKDVGTRQLIDKGSLRLEGAGSQNYELTTIGSQWNITPKPLDLYAVPDSKVYDSIDFSGKIPNVAGLVGYDYVSNREQAFDSKNVLGINNSTLYVKSYTVNDGNNGNNYSVTTHNATGTITPYHLTVQGGTVPDKAYDGTDLATVNGAYISPLPQDNVYLHADSVRFDDQYVAFDRNKKVFAYWSLGGIDASNYELEKILTIYPGRIYPPTLTGQFVCYLINNCGMQSEFGNQLSIVGTNVISIMGIKKAFDTASIAFDNQDWTNSPWLSLALLGDAAVISLTGIASNGLDYWGTLSKGSIDIAIEEYGMIKNWDAKTIADYKENANLIFDLGKLSMDLGNAIHASANEAEALNKTMDEFFERMSKDPDTVQLIEKFEALEATGIGDTLKVITSESHKANLDVWSDIISTGGSKFIDMYNMWLASHS